MPEIEPAGHDEITKSTKITKITKKTKSYFVFFFVIFVIFVGFVIPPSAWFTASPFHPPSTNRA
jgi:hypothetical protein